MGGPAVTITSDRGFPVLPVTSGAAVLSVVSSGGAPIVISPRGAPFILEGVAPIISDFDLTAGTFNSWTGYMASDPIMPTTFGSITAEPIPDVKLLLFAYDSGLNNIDVVFLGDAVDTLTGLTFAIGGTKLTLINPPIYNVATNTTQIMYSPVVMTDGSTYDIHMVDA